jgi:transketolase
VAPKSGQYSIMTPAQPAAAPSLEGNGTAEIDLDKHRSMANAIRALAMDAVEQAQSGHPGMPMGMADVATVLFSRFLRFDPRVPDWPDRDRFVLSAGHGSMLLYALLYLLGYEDMTIEEIRNFRQLGSRTPGHPEYGFAAGVETTTGPLGQGLANAVGMAIAERHLAARFGETLVDHRTFAMVGDGCLMEGISQEAITLAGHLKLNRLTVLWDDNSVTIDGPLKLSDSTDQLARFAACGWNVVAVDGHDPTAIAEALEAAQTSDKPSFIACKTVIGYGAPNKQGSAAAHGAPLGADEIAAARAQRWAGSTRRSTSPPTSATPGASSVCTAAANGAAGRAGSRALTLNCGRSSSAAWRAICLRTCARLCATTRKC